jgi:subtilisin family serine protease
VAGTIAARSDGRGVSGVAADANIVAIKVLDLDGVGSFADIIAGVNYVAMVGRAGDVANMSLGAGPINTSVIANDPISVAFRNACTAGASRGIFMVYAAGNDGLPAQFYIPAAYKGTNMWTIAAMNDADRFPAFSNWGPLIDFTEPGVDVISTYPGGGYAMLSGTSMAAPHFAGIVLATGGRPQNGGNVLNAALRAGTPATIGVLRR